MLFVAVLQFAIRPLLALMPDPALQVALVHSAFNLSAAVMALARQLNPAQASTGPRLEVLTFSLRALGPNGAVALNASELMVLRALVRSPDQRLAHWQLLEIMALSATDANQAKLAVRMSRLRKKLDSLGFSGPTLQVIRQEGYQLCLPVQLL